MEEQKEIDAEWVALTLGLTEYEFNKMKPSILYYLEHYTKYGAVEKIKEALRLPTEK